MILASILITANGNENPELPPIVAENIASFKASNPRLPHQLFTTSSIRQLIRQNFDAEVLGAFEKLRPFAYKSDLARYCIMYLHGGIYADLSTYFLGGWSPDFIASQRRREMSDHKLRLGVFRDFQSASVWDTANGVFSCSPKHRTLLLAIRMVCENVRSEYYGPTNLCPTGPTLFGKAIAMSCSPDDLTVGDSRWIRPSAKLKGIMTDVSHGFVFRDRIVAVQRKRGGAPLSDIGIIGGNNYSEMWASRGVYASDTSTAAKNRWWARIS